jgi:hypothetical protein
MPTASSPSSSPNRRTSAVVTVTAALCTAACRESAV